MTAADLAIANPPAGDQDAAIARTRRHVLWLTLILVVTAAAVLAYRTHALFEAELAPEVMLKSQTIAEFLAGDVERAVGYGIPIDELVGVEDYFEAERAEHPEIEFIALMGPDGRPLDVAGAYLGEEERIGAETAAKQLIASGAVQGDPRTSPDYHLVLAPVSAGSRTVAAVAIGTDPLFVHRQLQELAYDVLVILLVALFLAFEVALALLATRVVAPIDQLVMLMRAARAGDLGRRIAYRANSEIGRAIGSFNTVVEGLNERYGRLSNRLGDGVAAEVKLRFQSVGERFGLAAAGAVAARAAPSVTDVRLPLFIFILAEELQKAFLPLYVRSLEGSISWLSPEILIGLPISVYMATLALATPFAGSWADRYGTRRIFLLGLVPAFAGFVGSALASTVVELIVFRAMTAAGYAMCTIAAQGFIVQVTASRQRAQGVSSFVGVLMAASICGTAIGGILADRVGYRAVFLCAAALAVVAGVLALRMLSSDPAEPASIQRSRFRFADLRLLLSNWRFVALLLFAAIPGKIVLTGYLFYAVPLVLSSLAASESEIGRIMMVYSIVIVLLGPWLSRFADERGHSWAMVFAGTLVSGLGMALLYFRADTYGVLAGVVVIAVAHAASISPQVALVPDICRREIEKIGQTTVLSILRMVERAGSVIGPLLVASLVAQLGFVDGLALIGFGIAALSFLLLTAFAGGRGKREA